MNQRPAQARMVGEYEERVDGENPADLYSRTRDAADTLHARAAKIHELTERLEELTPSWYAGNEG